MKNLFIFIVLFSSFFISLYHCGHIYSQPTEIIPQNAQAATQFQFFFMLETSLALGDCLFIKFPMLVRTGTAAISQTMDPTQLATDITTTGHALDGASVSASIDTRFYVLSAGLSSGTWYRVQVNITDASTQSVGVQGCVWFATTSGFASNYITYDENRCFDVLSFAPTIDTSGSNFKVTGYYLFAATNTYKTFGGSYGVNFDITPSQNVDLPGAVFTITLPGLFTFQGTSCTSIACTNNDGSAGDYCISTNLTALPTSNIQCSTAANVLTLKVLQAVNLNTTRIQASVLNPYKYISGHVAPTATFQSAKAQIIFATSSVLVGAVNGINLVTDFTQMSLTGTVKLMWGATPSTTFTPRMSGFAGCPIVLYGSNSAHMKVYNSLQTSFTLTGSISAMKLNLYIRAQWTLVGALTLVDSVITNSLFTTMPTMPGTTIDTTNALAVASVVIFNGISDLAATTYTIGGKFSVDVSTDAKVVAVSTVASPSSPTCGAVSIQTGDGAKTYANVAGTILGVKKNMEYHDTTIANTGDGLLKLYNQLYSYWVDDTTAYNWGSNGAASLTAMTLFQTKFLGKNAGGATAAV